MDHHPAPGGGFPANPLEQALLASVGRPDSTAALLGVLAESQVWVPLPNGGSPRHPALDLPTVELEGVPYVPVFSSEEQLRRAAGDMPHAVAPMREFARGLPPQIGIAVNPEGEVGIPIPAPLVAELAAGPDPNRHDSPDPTAHPVAPQPSGARVQLWEPDPASEPVPFLAAAAGEFSLVPVVLSARRALASVEGADPSLFVGVELDGWQPEDRDAAMNALGRALGAAPTPWPVNIVLLDVAQDPVADWMLDQVTPFYQRG
ncbi:enhanced serine sensitivity protein SseB [Mangrovactinospora gilvigrisea]|uniref:Enhanced serine sensitivity protein SseB n=1 Tax=Mangrovactinospora gilvigrisea TaxID=1428644 RepID=A0A1J7BTI1_9ACTN|nr:enhanced serine sensitivity protein SseB [Mangrovactinospora gilvigrisea]OIV36761.1 enhanced serine sensitivity protein SseB [Mangrovactinospora gilvigrisea]